MKVVRASQDSNIRAGIALSGTPYSFARGYDAGAASAAATATLLGTLIVLLAALSFPG